MTASGLVLAGSKSILLALLRTLPPVRGVVTIDDRSDSRSTLDELDAECRHRNVSLAIAGTAEGATEAIANLDPSVVVAAGWYWRIPERLLVEIPLGVLGVHYSRLPKYRGGSPLVWALINGEATVGVSLFQMTSRLDDGPVWAQVALDVQPEDDVASVSARLEERAVDMVREALPGVLDGSLTPATQSDADATYCLQRLPDDGRVDVTLHADAIVRLIRAQTRPYPGAHVYRGAQKVVLWKARKFGAAIDGSPGQVAKVAGSTVMAAGDRTGVVIEESAPALRSGDRLTRDPL